MGAGGAQRRLLLVLGLLGIWPSALRVAAWRDRLLPFGASRGPHYAPSMAPSETPSFLSDGKKMKKTKRKKHKTQAEVSVVPSNEEPTDEKTSKKPKRKSTKKMQKQVSDREIPLDQSNKTIEVKRKYKKKMKKQRVIVDYSEKISSSGHHKTNKIKRKVVAKPLISTMGSDAQDFQSSAFQTKQIKKKKKKTKTKVLDGPMKAEIPSSEREPSAKKLKSSKKTRKSTKKPTQQVNPAFSIPHAMTEEKRSSPGQVTKLEASEPKRKSSKKTKKRKKQPIQTSDSTTTSVNTEMPEKTGSVHLKEGGALREKIHYVPGEATESIEFVDESSAPPERPEATSGFDEGNVETTSMSVESNDPSSPGVTNDKIVEEGASSSQQFKDNEVNAERDQNTSDRNGYGESIQTLEDDRKNGHDEISRDEEQSKVFFDSRDRMDNAVDCEIETIPSVSFVDYTGDPTEASASTEQLSGAAPEKGRKDTVKEEHTAESVEIQVDRLDEIEEGHYTVIPDVVEPAAENAEEGEGVAVAREEEKDVAMSDVDETEKVTDDQKEDQGNGITDQVDDVAKSNAEETEKATEDQGISNKCELADEQSDGHVISDIDETDNATEDQAEDQGEITAEEQVDDAAFSDGDVTKKVTEDQVEDQGDETTREQVNDAAISDGDATNKAIEDQAEDQGDATTEEQVDDVAISDVDIAEKIAEDQAVDNDYILSEEQGDGADVSQADTPEQIAENTSQDHFVEEKEENQEKAIEGIDDPYLEPSVVNFIGKVLDEDVNEVLAWTNEETSSSTDGTDESSMADSLNETRGGAQETIVPEEELDGTNAKGTNSIANNTNATAASERNVKRRKKRRRSKVSPKSSSEVASMDNEEDKSSAEALNNLDNSSAALSKQHGIVSMQRNHLETKGDKDSDAVVSIVTWNLAEESPEEDDASFIRKFRKMGLKDGSGSDLVLISGQECENIKPRRTEGRRSREYRRLMIKMLGKQYVPIGLHLLGGIQFGLFAKRSFLKQIEDVSIADVTCGIGNVFHNKGAIAAFVRLKARNPSESSDGMTRSKSLRMMFVTAHLAAHVKNSDARDADFWRISSELEAQAPPGFLPRQPSQSVDEDRSFLFDSVDRVFFCGDLNYRVDLPRELTECTVVGSNTNSSWLDLMKHDQLFRTMAEGRAFPGFTEGEITFAPTFKFDKETGDYDTSHKQRIPAWTDRILFKPWGTRVMEYSSVPDAQHSDHRPVHGTFRVSMEGREVPTKKSRKRPQKKKLI